VNRLANLDCDARRFFPDAYRRNHFVSVRRGKERDARYGSESEQRETEDARGSYGGANKERVEPFRERRA
jgi:hypothetical protein